MYEPFSPKFIANIEANRTVKDELLEAAKRPSVRRRISVTDLVNPRQSYLRRTRPDIDIPLERRQLMWAGTGFHELFGAAVSSEEYLWRTHVRTTSMILGRQCDTVKLSGRNRHMEHMRT